MNGVEWILGNEALIDTPLKPYSEEALAFCGALSAALMKSGAARRYPDASALAFWCRKANLQKLKENCPEADRRLGRGLCLHIAPSNVPINFAFSYLFGLLSGCSNLVRLPSKQFPVVDAVCDTMGEVLQRHEEIRRRTAFVRYDSGSDVTAELSKKADVRLIWGGDNTIATVKAQPARPRCVDIAFADRYSICILNGKALLAADDAQLQRLAENFYNDTYLMDQNACSSPQLVCFMDDAPAARERFWAAVAAAAEQKYYLQAAVSVDKYTKMCCDAVDMDTLLSVSRYKNILYRAELSRLDGDLTGLRGKGGYFYEYALTGLEELIPHITEKFQTVTYFGVDPELLRAFVVENNLRGIDRICPVGKAMDIGIVWDGFDLVRMLSRIVNVE